MRRRTRVQSFCSGRGAPRCALRHLPRDVTALLASYKLLHGYFRRLFATHTFFKPTATWLHPAAGSS